MKANNYILKKQQLLYTNIKELLTQARHKVLRTVNTTMVQTYFEIGRLIVQEDQDGKTRAAYGKDVLKNLGEKLSREFGDGFSERNLRLMRQFYLAYKNWQTVSAEFTLSWSHYCILMRMEEQKRSFYEIECTENNWSIRELSRQIDTALYERLALSRDKEKIKELSLKGQIIEKPEDMIKDPYIFEFLGLKEDKSYTESDLEQKLLDNLEQFLLELGKGFAFIARQQRISFAEDHFYVDLVFYNRLLKCFVVIDLKIGELKHQDLGQLQMYVNYYDRVVKTKEENNSIGILLCAEKNNAVVEMTLPKNSKNLFASKYSLYLPTKEQLIEQIKKL